MINLKTRSVLLFITLIGNIAFSQKEQILITNAIREISPSYRITETPQIIDTVVPTPKFEYPLLSRTVKTSISTVDIQASKIKIIEKLDKLYPGYIKLGLGNYTMPLGELYYNSERNRRMSYGIHANHLSSFGKIENYAPTQFDKTSAKLFGDFYTRNFLIESEVNWLNHGYHYYGIMNDSIPKDSLRNRVGGYQGQVHFSNYTKRDSAKLLYKFKLDYGYFHDFLRDSMPESTNGRENNFGIGSEWKFKHELNVFELEAGFRFNNYKFGESDTSLTAYAKDENNHIFNFKPTISSYRLDNKLKVQVGLNLNFDLAANKVFKPSVIANAKYSLLDGMFIPYIGLDGGLKQNSFQSLNRGNQFIIPALDLKNTKEFKFYAGIKGTLSKTVSFNLNFHSSQYTDMALYFNDTIFSDQYRFRVVYDNVSVIGFGGSLTYQKSEKLKVDAILDYNNYVAETQKYAWYLPELKLTLRGSYNVYDKLYAKLDFNMETGRKSPKGLLNPDATQTEDLLFSTGIIADANLHLEYRYNRRISAFLQFNNMANQKYQRWLNYPVYGFQVLGGVTFGF
tara:strand:- start:597 stop:2297 length:1701 start_codon:yes stop_codon:yes gene_type:complete